MLEKPRSDAWRTMARNSKYKRFKAPEKIRTQIEAIISMGLLFVVTTFIILRVANSTVFVDVLGSELGQLVYVLLSILPMIAIAVAGFETWELMKMLR